MKRLLAITLVIMLSLIAVFSFSVNAEENDFSVTFDGSKYVYPGNTCWFYVSIGKAKEDIRSLSVEIEYDTDFFEFVSLEVEDISTDVDNWSFGDVGEIDGVISINIYDNSIIDGTEANPLTGSLEIVYMLKLETKSGATGTSDIVVTRAEGGTSHEPNLQGECNTMTVTAVAPLTRPSVTGFENGVVTWGAVENAASYEVAIYRSGLLVETVKGIETTSLDVNPYFAKYLGGSYTVKVTAISDSPAYSDSVSKESGSYKYKGQLAKPSITVSADSITGKVNYTITDTNADGLVQDYTIRVYEKGSTSPIHELYGSKGANNTLTAALTPGKTYEITVEAISGTSSYDTGNASSGESEKVSVTVDAVSSISITHAPLLNYVEGETLNLSALVVTIKYVSGNEVPVSLKDFEKYGINVSPANGADLTLSMSGRKIVVTLGSLTAPEQYVIEVESGECKHDGETQAEHKDATCGEGGYDKVVCKLCGVAIESTVITATGNHQYNDWSWLFEPTQSIDGIRIHKCQICGHEETQNVSYEDYLASQTTPGKPDDSDDPVQTTPDESGNGEVTTETPENDPLGGLGNIGKIFLIALVIIFAVIVLFIVLAIWSESRGRRRRRSNKRAGGSGKRPPQNQNRPNPQNRPRR